MHRFVPKQETCQLLKEAGAPQEGGEFYWVYLPYSDIWILRPIESIQVWDNRRVRAPLTDELIDFMKSAKWDEHPVVRREWQEKVRDCIWYSDELLPESLAKLCLELVGEGVELW